MVPFTYSGNKQHLVDRAFYVTKHGSQAYGTSTPTSDTDYKGIFKGSISEKIGFVEKTLTIDKGFSDDVTYFELGRFFELAANANPNIIEMLYTAPEDLVLCTPLGDRLRSIRHLFLSTKVRHTFSGYAFAQLKRIEGHNRWLSLVAAGKEPKAPTRAEFGLPEAPLLPKEQREAIESVIKKQVEEWDIALMDSLDEALRVALRNELTEKLTQIGIANHIDAFRTAGRHIGVDDDLMEIVMKERGYKEKLVQYRQYCEWVTNRNEHRSELEKKFGYDTKHAMHLVRLMRMAKEVLRTGQVIVKRPDAEELLAIRNGAWTYERVVSWAKDVEAELPLLEKVSPLPRSPDRLLLNKHLLDLYGWSEHEA